MLITILGLPFSGKYQLAEYIMKAFQYLGFDKVELVREYSSLQDPKRFIVKSPSEIMEMVEKEDELLYYNDETFERNHICLPKDSIRDDVTQILCLDPISYKKFADSDRDCGDDITIAIEQSWANIASEKVSRNTIQTKDYKTVPLDDDLLFKYYAYEEELNDMTSVMYPDMLVRMGTLGIVDAYALRSSYGSNARRSLYTKIDAVLSKYGDYLSGGEISEIF